MSYKQGEKTGAFGEWLTDYLKNSSRFGHYLVFYDHGDAKTYSNVVAVKGLFGQQVSRQNQLAHIDVMIAKPDGEAVLLIEIEESGFTPKKVVGDIFTILMCNKFAVLQKGINQYFQVTPATKLFVVGAVETRGSKLEQINEVILPRIRQFQTPPDGIRSENITLIGGDLPSVLKNLENAIRRIFPREENTNSTTIRSTLEGSSGKESKQETKKRTGTWWINDDNRYTPTDSHARRAKNAARSKGELGKKRCPTCGKYVAYLERHIKLAHEQAQQCPECGKWLADLDKHLKLAHGISSE